MKTSLETTDDFNVKWEQQGKNLLINIRLDSDNLLVQNENAGIKTPILDAPPLVDGIFVRNGPRFDKIKFEDILFLEAQGAYTIISTKQKKYTLARNLTRCCKGLPYPFMRVHRSYTINLENIDSFSESLVYFSDKKIPVSDPYRKELASHFNCI